MSTKPRWIEVGERVGRLVVTVRREPGQPRVSCRCDCGTDRSVPLGEWGKSLSCGCLRIERLLVRNTTHGHSRTSIYLTWSDMVNRCKNSTHHHWDDYGGRGIRVCEQWQGRGGFTVFLADMGERPAGLTLDRTDNDGNYEPGNCRWATPKQQRANRRPQKAKTHCVRGHEFTPDNTAITTDGKRRCRACTRRHAAKQRARKAAMA